MNYLILSSLFISLFSTITAMEITPKKSHTWVETNDKQIINVDKTIARQSNLISVLREKYAGTNKKPIPIPVNKNELEFFCNSITQHPHDLANKLSDKDYSHLMKITDKLKSSLFYAELMEPLLPIKELQNQFAYGQLNHVELKKIIYKKCLKRRCIKNNHKNGTNTFSINFSNDGNYFTETISKDHGYVTHLWNTKKLSVMQTLKYKQLIFSPNNDYIICNHGLYHIQHKEYHYMQFNNEFYKPHISPDGRFFIHSSTKYDTLYSLYNADTFDEHSLLPEDSTNDIESVFHPNNTALIYTRDNTGSNQIIICDLKDPNNKQTKTYSKTPGFCHNNKLTLSTDGSLLLLNHNILLNIQDPYNPIIIKEWEFNLCIQRTFQAFFIPHKNIIVYCSGSKTLCLINDCGDTIATYEAPIAKITADTTGNYLAFLIKDKGSETSSTIALWNLSHLPSRIDIIKIKTNTHIHTIAFTKDQLLLTQSYTTKLWDMNGNEILNLGQSTAYGINPQTGSIITAHNTSTIIPTTDHRSHVPISGPTKMYYYDINAQQANSLIKKITESLTLPQALLLNKHFAHKRTKKHRKMPDLVSREYTSAAKSG